MKLPVDVVFRNLTYDERLDADIRRRIAKLDTYCPDIMSCRATLEIPHRHRLHGNRFQLRLDISVPGEEIVISRSPQVRATARRQARRMA